MKPIAEHRTLDIQLKFIGFHLCLGGIMKRLQIKKIIYDRMIEVQRELEEQAEKTGLTTTQVMLNNPFLAGRVHAMNLLTLDLMAALNDPDDEELIVMPESNKEKSRRKRNKSEKPGRPRR